MKAIDIELRAEKEEGRTNFCNARRIALCNVILEFMRPDANCAALTSATKETSREEKIDALLRKIGLKTDEFVSKAFDSRQNDLLELLGDGILSFIVTEWQLSMSSGQDEYFELRHSLFTNNAHLAVVAEKLGITRDLLKCDLKSNPKKLADSLEALVAAIYLKYGLPVARKFVIDYIIRGYYQRWSPIVENCQTAQDNEILALAVQRGNTIKEEYIAPQAPDDTFICRCWIPENNDKFFGEGRGKNKDEAKNKAMEALRASIRKHLPVEFFKIHAELPRTATENPMLERPATQIDIIEVSRKQMRQLMNHMEQERGRLEAMAYQHRSTEDGPHSTLSTNRILGLFGNFVAQALIKLFLYSDENVPNAGLAAKIITAMSKEFFADMAKVLQLKDRVCVRQGVELNNSICIEALRALFAVRWLESLQSNSCPQEIAKALQDAVETSFLQQMTQKIREEFSLKDIKGTLERYCREKGFILNFTLEEVPREDCPTKKNQKMCLEVKDRTGQVILQLSTIRQQNMQLDNIRDQLSQHALVKLLGIDEDNQMAIDIAQQE